MLLWILNSIRSFRFYTRESLLSDCLASSTQLVDKSFTMAAMLFDAKGLKDLSSGPPDASQGVHPLKLDAKKLDIEAIKARYEAERLKRHRSDGTAQYRPPRGPNAVSGFRQDIHTPNVAPRDPITSETKVVIVGAGFAGLATAVKLKKDQNVDDFFIVDKAGGFGGTWYWNQYPGRSFSLSLHIV